jgi:CRISPR/Cas system-associated exonuclease Cas4 (RecB family)
MKTHSRLSPSSAHRWLACSGSIKAEEDYISLYGEKESPFDASEGTAAHELAELALNNNTSCYEWEGKMLPENDAFTATKEMCDYVQQYVDYVRSLQGEQSYEVVLDLTDYIPEGYGTSDAIVFKGETLYVVDLKYGKGVQVYAKDNEQAQLYALGALEYYSFCRDKIKKVVITIVQPRLDHIDEWETTPEQLEKFGQYVIERSELCNEEKPERTPGEKQCRFCLAKAICPSLKKLTEDVLLKEFDNLEHPPLIEKLSDSELRKALENKSLIVSWLGAIEEHIMTLLLSGKDFSGYKLVEGRSLRQWRDESKAVSILESANIDPYTKKVISVAQAEKILGKTKKDLISDLVYKPNGKPTLAPEEDKRKSLGASVDDFDLVKD